MNKWRVIETATYKDIVETKTFEYNFSFKWQAGSKAFADMKRYLANKYPEPYELSEWKIKSEVVKL